MQIEIAELRKVCDMLLAHVENRGLSTIDINQDYYWNVPIEGRYNPYETPTELDLGQLSDDWTELQRFLSGSEPLSYGLVWLSSILRVVGETVGA